MILGTTSSTRGVVLMIGKNIYHMITSKILETATLSKKKRVRLALESKAKRGYLKCYTNDLVTVAYAITEGMHTSRVGNLTLVKWENYEPLRSITDKSDVHIKQQTDRVRNLSKTSYFGPLDDFKGCRGRSCPV